MNIYLVKQCETDWIKEGKFEGFSETFLNETGLLQAQLIGKQLRRISFNKIYSSSLSRTVECSEIINTYLRTEIITDDKLKDINWGLWEGKTWLEIQKEFKPDLVKWLKNPINCPTPNGESYLDLQSRILSSLLDIVLANDESNEILIVTHGTVIKTFVCTFLGLDLHKRGNFDIDNGSITKLKYTKSKNKFKVVSLNDCSHLT